VSIIIESTNQKVLLPALGALLTLRDKNLNETISAIYLLQSSQFQKLTTILHEFAPDLENDINCHIKSNNIAIEKGNLRKVFEELLINEPDQNNIEKITRFLLDQINTKNNADFWNKYFVKSLNYLFRVLGDKNSPIEVMKKCLEVIKSIIIAENKRINPILETFVHNVLGCYQFTKELWDISSEIFDIMINTFGVIKMLRFLSNKLDKEDPPVLQNLIKLVAKCIKILSKDELISEVRNFSGIVTALSNNSNTEVKKATMVILVQINTILGEEFDNIFN